LLSIPADSDFIFTGTFDSDLIIVDTDILFYYYYFCYHPWRSYTRSGGCSCFLLCSQHPWRYIIGCCCLIGLIVVIVVATVAVAVAIADADSLAVAVADAVVAVAVADSLAVAAVVFAAVAFADAD
jgi:hypothetical protein